MAIAGPVGRWRRAFGVALAIALLGPAPPAGSQPRKPREVRLEISSVADWAPTGIVVRADDALVIIAETDGSLSPGGFADLPPEGAPAPYLPIGALIGRIGGSRPFLVGAGYKDRVAVAGEVSLRLNYGRRPPQGALRAVVQHQPAKPIEDPDDNETGSGGGDDDSAGKLVDGNGAAAEEDEGSNLPIDNGGATAGEHGSDLGRLDPGGEDRVPEPRPEQGIQENPVQAALAWLGGGALILLAAVAAALSLRRVLRRRTVQRTRALLSLSPSLDLGEGRSGGGGGGGDWPAEGPAASLRARLDEGAIRSIEGGEDE